MKSTLNGRISRLLVLLVLSTAICRATIMGTDRDGIHSFGQRTEDDRLLYYVQSPEGKSGFLSLTYQSPSSAEGPEITYAEVYVTGIYNETIAYVSSGGIGKKSIVIVLARLQKKSVFDWEGAVYGRQLLA